MDGRVEGAFFRGDAAVDDGLVVFFQAVAQGGLVLVARYVDDGIGPGLEYPLYDCVRRFHSAVSRRKAQPWAL